MPIVRWAAERPDHTLQTTALVNEAYLRLADQTHPRWQNRAHFFAVAARAMRQILVSYARSQRSEKRGGGAIKIELDEAALVSPEESKEIVDLHEALETLATLDSRKAQVVELKYFGGLNYEEIAEVLKISRVTVRRDWEFAKVWLYTELHDTADTNFTNSHQLTSRLPWFAEFVTIRVIRVSLSFRVIRVYDAGAVTDD